MKLNDRGARRAARNLYLVTLSGLVLIAVASLYAAVTLMVGQPDLHPVMVDVGDASLPPWSAALLALIVGGLLIVALARLAAMLRAIEAGAMFVPSALRAFAFYLFLAVLVDVAGPPLIQTVRAITGEGGSITLAIGGGEALMLFVTGLLFLVARLLHIAEAIADDSSQIV